MKKLAKVDEIFKELDEKHHGKFTPEQLNSWGHLVQSGKHASLDIPPDMPFLEERTKKRITLPHLHLKPLHLLHHSQPAQ